MEYGPQRGDNQTFRGLLRSITCTAFRIPSFVLKSHPFHRERRSAASSRPVSLRISAVRMLVSEQAISNSSSLPLDSREESALGSMPSTQLCKYLLVLSGSCFMGPLSGSKLPASGHSDLKVLDAVRSCRETPHPWERLVPSEDVPPSGCPLLPSAGSASGPLMPASAGSVSPHCCRWLLE